MSKKNIIRIDDKVKIIHPEFFIRCGYNLCLKDVTEKIIEERSEEIEEFIDKFFNITNNPKEQMNKFGSILLNPKERKISNTGKEIAKALAYRQMRKENFGGRERKLFTEIKEEYKNSEFIVADIKIHKTGIYYAPYSGYDYEGGYDYEPGGLSNMKTHKILELWPTFKFKDNELKIEAIHVEKLNEEKK